MDENHFKRELTKEEKIEQLAKKREQEVKAFGFAKTRLNKRKSKALYEKTNKIFGRLTEDFTNVFIAESFNSNSPEVTKAFDRIDLRWRIEARHIIGKHYSTFNERPKRERLLNRFTEFVESLIEKVESNNINITPEEKHGFE